MGGGTYRGGALITENTVCHFFTGMDFRYIPMAKSDHVENHDAI